ncbi:MAG: hypothetical protein FVQ81_11415 [Candidatus Glassbacteria bacterium]|nr:hypothetical protein [Candidatus Glassbacteria bacterium]
MAAHHKGRATLSESLGKPPPVASAYRRRASKSLDDVTASPAAFLLPGGTPRRSLWVIISAPWYYPGEDDIVRIEDDFDRA